MRYDQILKIIDLQKPQRIVEIGCWNGDNAIRMIQTALKYHDTVEYYGYDLFEDATSETDALEFNVKPHNQVDAVSQKILHYCPRAKVMLFKGNTRETLKSHPPYGDFCYIDGGHSIETIANDYEACKNITVIVFDDYYVKDDKGLCPDLEQVGCNKLIESLAGCVVLPDADPIKGGGLTKLVVKL